MTPEPPKVEFITAAYCEHHGYTEYACTKCLAERQARPADGDLAAIKELHKLRAEVERLTAEMEHMRAGMEQLTDVIQRDTNDIIWLCESLPDDSNKICGETTKQFIIETVDAIYAAALNINFELNGGAS